MEIVGLEDLTPRELADELDRGARFVVYRYCVSLILVTFQRSSSIYFIRSDEGALAPGLKWSLLSLVTGWWGFPWGPIFTVSSLVRNFAGGQDVTGEVVSALKSSRS